MTEGKINYLFSNFLSDKRIYRLNQNYWAKEVGKLFTGEIKAEPHWYRTQYANGVEFYDGNPIYSTLIDNNRSLRIIQEEPEMDEPEISAWIQDVEYQQNNVVKELTISLELSDTTKKMAFDLIKNWSKKEITETQMNDYINQLK